MGTAAEPLAYAPPPARRRRWWLLGVLLCGIVLIGWASRRYGLPVWRHLQLVALERKCLKYAPPPDQVVYEEEPTEVAFLVASDPGYRYRAGYREAPSYCYYAPTLWAQYPLGRWEPGPRFLHERRGAGGSARLIAVDLSRLDNGFYFYPRIIQPATLSSPPKLLKRIYAMGLRLEPTDEVRIYAGQADPNDSSHFTIRFMLNGTAGMIDGWIRADDTVSMKPVGWMKSFAKGDVSIDYFEPLD